MVGDRVIQAVAEVIKKGIDPELDTICRYGGDEFLIGSTVLRRGPVIADIIQERIAAVKVEGLAESISATYGMAGGRVRESVRRSTTPPP